MSRLFSTYKGVAITSKVESDPSDIWPKLILREAWNNAIGVM